MQDEEGAGIKVPKRSSRPKPSSFSFLPVNRRWVSGGVFLILFLVLSAGAIFIIKHYLFSPLQESEEEQSTSQQLDGIEKYQAIFLDNGQVYFGKLVRREGDFYRLENVFYFKQNPQTPGASKTPEQNVSLSKLGGEAHGPEDFMEINKDHIIFIEDLKEESPVVKAMTEYTEKKIE